MAENQGKPAVAENQGTILAIRACNFFMICSLTIPGSSIAEVNKDLQGTASSLGSVRTAAQIITLVMGLGLTTLMHAIGTKKALIGVCAVSTVGRIVMTVAPSLSVFYAGLILSVMRLHCMTIGKAIIADTCSSEDLPAQFGTIGMISGLAFVLGPVLSIILEKTIGQIWVAGCLCGFIAVGIALSMQEVSLSSQTKTDTDDTTKTPALVLELLPYVLVSIACTLPFSAILFGLDSYLVTRFGLAPGGIAGVTVVVALAYSFSQGALFKRLHRLLGSVTLLVCSAGVAAAPLLIVDWLGSVPKVTVALTVSVLAFGCVQSSIDVMMVGLTSPNKARGTALTATMASFNSSIIPVISGFILDAGLPLYRIFASLCAVAAVLGFAFLPRERVSEKDKAQ